jgi:hypothetical protein
MTRLRIDASEFARLLNETQDIDKQFALGLLREIRAAAKPLKSKMQRAVKDPRSKRSSRIRQTKRKQRTGEEYQVVTNTADLVARGISFRMNRGKSGASAMFRSSSRYLPGKREDGSGSDRKAMIRAFNKTTFRHPVIGTTTEPVKGGAPGERKARPRGQWHWSQQAGRPYFGSVILDERADIERAILRAMDQATDRIARSRLR